MSIIGVHKFAAMTLIALAGLGVLVATSATPAVGANRDVPTGDTFYLPPQPLAKAKPGVIIRSTPIDAPAGARAWKILYHSRAVDGRDIAVSGVVIAPTGPAPRGGRVVVSWAHGTTGLADVCAPSKQPDIASGIPPAQRSTPLTIYPGTLVPMVKTFLDAGYVIAATDYEGLGTPGLHPYEVGESEGRSVLDAARAAHGLKATAAGNDALVLGHSEGGGAALFAGELAATYAPDLRVLGVAAEAPVTDVEHNLAILESARTGNGIIAMEIQGFHAAYPRFDPAAVLTPAALAQASIIDQKCAIDVNQTFSSSPDLVLAHDPLGIPSMAALLHANSAGNRPAGTPLLVLQGTADLLVPRFLTDTFVEKACGNLHTVPAEALPFIAPANKVDYRVYSGVNHVGVVAAAANDVAAWFAGRVSGTPATNTCT